ncbi:MAG: hypothetical protein ACKPKO_51930, partial [Candidatus Fonsibacter sp.]
MTRAMALANIPKASGTEVIDHSCIAQLLVAENQQTYIFIIYMLSLLTNLIIAISICSILFCYRLARCIQSANPPMITDAAASDDLPPAHSPIVDPIDRSRSGSALVLAPLSSTPVVPSAEVDASRIETAVVVVVAVATVINRGDLREIERDTWHFLRVANLR